MTLVMLSAAQMKNSGYLLASDTSYAFSCTDEEFCFPVTLVMLSAMLMKNSANDTSYAFSCADEELWLPVCQ